MGRMLFHSIHLVLSSEYRAGQKFLHSKFNTLTEAHLGSFMNFSQLSRTAKFKIEPKCPAVKVTFLSKVALLHLLNDFLYEIE